MEWTRRGLLKAGMGMAAALASGCGSDSEAVGAASSPDPTGRRPNVLILLTDQERYPQHWPPGLKDQLMPSWQRLRRHGLEFHRAFTASSLCSPSRACLLTSHYSNVNKVPSPQPLPPSWPTGCLGPSPKSAFAEPAIFSREIDPSLSNAFPRQASTPGMLASA